MEQCWSMTLIMTKSNDANSVFERITAKCDFYNVFSPIPYNEVLPELSWQDFVELSNFCVAWN